MEGQLLHADKLKVHRCGGMRERLKRAVLKTAVRETVPGVRIPLPPPHRLISREFARKFFRNSRKYR